MSIGSRIFNQSPTNHNFRYYLVASVFTPKRGVYYFYSLSTKIEAPVSTHKKSEILVMKNVMICWKFY